MLALFLDLRLAFWVSLGIPISFLGAIMLMPANDVTVNIMSLFAFILVLGIVVDDAIIVERTSTPTNNNTATACAGSIDGAQEIATPVIFAVLTTVAAFTPLMFVPGAFGKFFKVHPVRRHSLPPLFAPRVTEHPAGSPVAPQTSPGRCLGSAPRPRRGRSDAVRPVGLSTASRDLSSLAVRDRGSRRLRPHSDHWNGPRGQDRIPFLPSIEADS